jgi:hypothetical protein
VKSFCKLHYMFRVTLVIIRCLKLSVKTAVLPFLWFQYLMCSSHLNTHIYHNRGLTTICSPIIPSKFPKTIAVSSTSNCFRNYTYDFQLWLFQSTKYQMFWHFFLGKRDFYPFAESYNHNCSYYKTLTLLSCLCLIGSALSWKVSATPASLP